MKAIPGDRYKHYKGKEYTVLHLAYNSENLADEVVYQAEYTTTQFGERPIWVRPRTMFEEQIMVDGKMVDRFINISKSLSV